MSRPVWARELKQLPLKTFSMIKQKNYLPRITKRSIDRLDEKFQIFYVHAYTLIDKGIKENDACIEIGDEEITSIINIDNEYKKDARKIYRDDATEVFKRFRNVVTERFIQINVEYVFKLIWETMVQQFGTKAHVWLYKCKTECMDEIAKIINPEKFLQLSQKEQHTIYLKRLHLESKIAFRIKLDEAIEWYDLDEKETLDAINGMEATKLSFQGNMADVIHPTIALRVALLQNDKDTKTMFGIIIQSILNLFRK